MEEERQVTMSAPEKGTDVLKGNGGLKIACAILAVAVVGLVAYLIVDKANIGQKTNCITNNAAGNGEKATSENVGFVYTTSTYASYGNYGDYVVTKDGDVYFIPRKEIVWDDDENNNSKVSFSVDSEVGAPGKFEFEPEDIEYYTPPMGDGQKISFEGYKLNLSNVQYVVEVDMGQQKGAASAAIIDRDGNMSLLLSSSFGENTTLKLKKNVEGNVSGIVPAYHGSGWYPVVYYRDGGSKKLDDNMLSMD